LVVSALVLCWTVYRDFTSDSDELDARISTVETKVALMDQSLTSLEQEQDQMKKTLKNLEDSVHMLDIKIERVITMLETLKNKKGLNSLFYLLVSSAII
jgi:chromosome segregation ATPase